MKFKFNVNLTQEDYIEFNKVAMYEMSAGKKLVKGERIFFAVFCAIAIVAILLYYKLSLVGFVAVGLFLIATVLVQLLLKPFLNVFLKVSIKSMSKTKGKMPFTEHSVIEFYDDVFVEISEDNKNEVKYSAIDDVFVNGKFVVIFISKIQAYILPVSCFESNEQLITFLKFISEKRQAFAK
ncbi:MAG: YcxB family protein [Ruminococcaceae bacterium]|nr:YcxB family protein [Oscillospiraceae bacterium]